MKSALASAWRPRPKSPLPVQQRLPRRRSYAPGRRVPLCKPVATRELANLRITASTTPSKEKRHAAESLGGIHVFSGPRHKSVTTSAAFIQAAVVAPAPGTRLKPGGYFCTAPPTGRNTAPRCQVLSAEAGLARTPPKALPPPGLPDPADQVREPRIAAHGVWT